MASTFKGQVWDRGSAHHVFYVDGSDTYDRLLLSEFNLFSYRENYVDNKAIERMWYDYFGNSFTPPSDPLDLAPSNNVSFDHTFVGTRWNGTKYIDFQISRSDLYDVLEYWEAQVTGAYRDGTEYSLVLSLQAQLEDVLLCTENHLQCETEDAIAHCWVGEPQAKKVSNKRSVAQNGKPTIVATPTNVVGKRYSGKKTADNQSPSTVGALVNPTNDDENSEDQVAGELNVSYNENTGKWEPQTQIMARLVTALDSANVPSVDLSTGVFNPNDFSDTGSQLYIGQFTTALAIPIRMHNGNPATYGPTFYQCEDNKIEKIRVVNRSNRTFTAGTVVLCHYIDGEWIAQDFGADLEQVPRPAEIDNNWKFSKFLASSDVHFKQALRTGQSVPENVTSDQIETFFRNACYYAVGTYSSIYSEDYISMSDMALLNTYPFLSWETAQNNGLIDPNPITNQDAPYLTNLNIQSVIVDQLGPELCGNSTVSYLQRTNMYHPATKETQDGGPGDQYFGNIGLYWGPCFPEGYKSSDYYSQVARSGTFISRGYWGDKVYTDGASISASVKPAPNSYSQDASPPAGMFANSSDTNLKQLPPELAVQSSGNPQEMYSRKNNILVWWDSADFFTDLGNIIDGQHNVWIDGSDGEDGFGFTPVDVTTVAFHPLTDNYACHADSYSVYTDSDRDYYTDTRTYLKGVAAEGPGIQDADMWGKMFDPDRIGSALDYYTTSMPDCDAIYSSGVAGGELQDIGSVVQPVYDVYCKYQATSKPINCLVEPFYHSDECAKGIGGNLVGVITARNTFTKVGGGDVQFEIDQRFGYQGSRTNSGSTNVYNSFMNLGTLTGSFLGSIIGGSQMNQNTISAWGSNDNDDIDSFGTTALHVKVYDAWPREQTIFFDPYFAVCHVSAGKYDTEPESIGPFHSKISNAGTDDANTDYNDITEDYDEQYLESAIAEGSVFAWYQSVPSYDVDMQIPTYGLGDKEGQFIPKDTLVDYFTPIRPADKWNTVTYRRGLAMNNGGMRYWRNVIGLSDNFAIDNGGSGFTTGQYLDASNGVRMLVTSVGDNGAVTGLVFATVDGDEDNNYVSNTQRGEGFLPNNFDPTDGYILSLSSASSTAPCVLRFSNGVVYQRMYYHEGPEQRVPKTRLSYPSGDGKTRIVGALTASVNLGAGNSSGGYEAFFYFHNDISHNIFFTVPTAFGSQPSNMQYITMTMK